MSRPAQGSRRPLSMRLVGRGSGAVNVRADEPDGETWYSSGTLLRIGVLVAVIAPLCVLALVLAVRIGPHFAAGSDNAVNELRLRDIGAHPVLLGPYARDGWSHPGPAMYYLLVVGYRLTGSTSIGMYLTALVINGGSIAGILALSRRFGGNSLFVVNGLGMAVLIHHLGPQFLSDPWNPYLAVLPYGAFLFCCWAAVCRARWMIPLVVGLASFCVQTHIGCLPLTLPVIGWSGAAILYQIVRDRRPPPRTELLTAAIVGGLMWLPPVIQQLTARRGNLSALWSYFRHPKQPIHSVTQGYEMVAHSFSLDAEWWHPHRWGALAGVVPQPPTVVPVVLVAFAAASILIVRRGPVAARALVGAITVSIASAILTIWRMPGPLNDYRFGWLPMLAVMTASGVVWFVLDSGSAANPRTKTSAGPDLRIAALMIGIAGVAIQNISEARAVRLESSTAAGADVVPTLLSRARDALPVATRTDHRDFHRGLQRSQVVRSGGGPLARGARL